MPLSQGTVSPRARVLTRTKNSTTTRPAEDSNKNALGRTFLSNQTDHETGIPGRNGEVSSVLFRRENPLTRISTETQERVGD